MLILIVQIHLGEFVVNSVFSFNFIKIMGGTVKNLSILVLLSAVLIFNSGCSTISDWFDGDEESVDESVIPGADEGPGPWTEEGETLPPRSGELQPIKGISLPTVYFAYDQSRIGATECVKLEQAADYLLKHNDISLIIEGHCDERGSIEYNRALGERRALAVRDYLSKLGIGEPRMQTISYGEERPAVQGTTESAYSKNRRAELIPAR